MSTEDALREKLRKIEALFAGAQTQGERVAAGAAADRIRVRLAETQGREAATEMKFSLGDPWSRQLFVALCRRYGLRPYRYPRMKRQTLVVRVPPTFLNTILWPQFREIDAALHEYLAGVTDRVIRTEVYGRSGEAEEVSEP
ncbi:MAG: hypothetical protein ACREC6_03165 [Hyphomicrobiaceae bacterium]